MQLASKEYIESMKQPVRNRGYIKVSIGVVNSDAQNNAKVQKDRTPLTYFSDAQKPFDGYTVIKVYATSEQDLSKVDGSMYFLPEHNSGVTYYNNGIVTKELLGNVYISFGNLTGLDIKGLTIDFGECYPTNFTIESDSGIKSYENNSQLFVTEDSFDGASYFIVTPVTMVNGQGRMRIFRFTCGIANVFFNDKVKNFRLVEYVSPISETVPSMDVNITIDNQDLYYSVDNPESAIAYMEVGQEVKVAFGYDVTGNGDIEWLSETTTYLNTWSADDVDAEFSSTDIFYQLGELYYGGLYRPNGINLYNLAVEVFESAGITDERRYYIDPYLKKIDVYNPLPVVTHAEALQIIANAGRCVLYEDRSNKIHLKSSFVPDMVATANNKTKFSSLNNLLKDKVKNAYAMASNDFSIVNGSLFFLPKNENYLEVEYVSQSIWYGPIKNAVTKRLGFRLGTNDTCLNEDGFWYGEVPKITISLEAAFTAFGILINFRNIAPKEFVVRTYLDEVKVDELIVINPDLEYITDKQFNQFNEMQIEFTKGYPNSRITVDNILIGDVTNYTISRTKDLTGSPKGTRQEKVKSISVKKTNYRQSQEGFKELISEEITISKDSEYIVYFAYPSYGMKVHIKDNEAIKAEIIESSNYFAKIKISGIIQEINIELIVEGYEYVTDESYFKKTHNPNGQEISWGNPLISTTNHAKDLEEWLSTYYLGDVDYEIAWRGDPRVEANDLFYLELKDREKALIRSYQNELEFNGAWIGALKARKVVMEWQ